MKLLALDLGTVTGFCVGTAGTHISGTASFKTDRFSGGGVRYLNFRRWLDELFEKFAFEQVAFERVSAHRGVTAAHVYGGLLAVLTAWCEENSIPYEGVHVGTIKKSFTGNGSASKNAMIEEARSRGYEPVDDNEADAIAVFLHSVGTLPTTGEPV